MSAAKPVVAITGAASGIGRALAQRYAREGAMLSLADRADAEQLDALRRECLVFGAAGVLVQRLDVVDADAVKAWAEATHQQFGRVNVLINNAGVNLSGCFEKTTREDFEWLMDINFWGVVNGCEAFLPYLKQAEWGHIVNLSSLFGLIAMPNQSAYNAAKFAVRGFTESLALEMAQSAYDIRVSSVHPGGVATNIVNSARFGQPQLGEVDIEEAKRSFNEKLARTTADQAAAIIAKGVAKRRKRILVGADAKFIDLLQRLWPTFYQRLVLRFVDE